VKKSQRSQTRKSKGWGLGENGRSIGKGRGRLVLCRKTLLQWEKNKNLAGWERRKRDREACNNHALFEDVGLNKMARGEAVWGGGPLGKPGVRW